MHFQFLIEDQSSELLISELMTKVQMKYPSITFDLKAFHGIGHVPPPLPGAEVRQVKTDKLLNSLPLYLKGFDKRLSNISAALFVVLDNDGRDPEAFKLSLQKLACQCQISTDSVFCIAVEEIEAWLIGDMTAVFAAYPHLFQKMKTQQKKKLLKDCECKSSHGTWKDLADILYPGGAEKMKKSGYPEIGIKKCEWASKIGACMDWDNNSSPSFRNFRDEVMKRIC